MTQFDLPQRKNSYFFHFGVLDSGYVENSRRSKANERQKNTLEKDNERLKTVISTLEDGLDSVLMSFDMSTLEYNIQLRQKDIKIVLEEIAKITEMNPSTVGTRLARGRKILKKVWKEDCYEQI